ncbi:hypothetical protein H4W31_005715 [Plantactinospora soyae]|uniref:Uncharacterized protein n=1 Tax=Plantactinospora soyae TaxID=1544732 RepID=A0A927MAE7_9ACTN|nr:hypothetical protein [Plantactinospora soyae]
MVATARPTDRTGKAEVRVAGAHPVPGGDGTRAVFRRSGVPSPVPEVAR